ncbi:hypothetical protein ACQP04_15930 [Pseudonocardia halophobica]|uniref:hypothetical protein n=1 Tax=Pseudonocardia halophobica TaxID=29401 RepID=UPI003D8D3C6A
MDRHSEHTTASRLALRDVRAFEVLPADVAVQDLARRVAVLVEHRQVETVVGAPQVQHVLVDRDVDDPDDREQAGAKRPPSAA